MANLDGDGPVQERRTWDTRQQLEAFGIACGTFGLVSGVAQLIGSSPRTLLITAAICTVVAVATVLALHGRRRTRLPVWVLAVVLTVAVALGALGAGVVQASFWKAQSPVTPPPENTRSDGSPSPTPSLSPPPSTTPDPTPPSPTAGPVTSSPGAVSVPPAAPTVVPICAGEFRAEVWTVSSEDSFDVVASFGCMARDRGHPTVTSRVSGVGEHRTTNFYPLQDFAGRDSPFTFHSKPVKPNPQRCYVAVVFPDGLTPDHEYVEKLPDGAYEASKCVQSP